MVWHGHVLEMCLLALLHHVDLFQLQLRHRFDGKPNWILVWGEITIDSLCVLFIYVSEISYEIL